MSDAQGDQSSMQEINPSPEAVPPLADEHAWLDGGQTYVACAFYTPNYEARVRALKASLEAHKINHYLKRYDRAATWEATTRIKAQFVKHCLGRFPDRDVMYVDADAVLRSYPKFIDTVKTDIGLLFHPKKTRRHPVLRISLGTFFIRNTPGGRVFADLWAGEETNAKLTTCDDDMIIAVFDRLTGVSMTVLPRTYYKVFDQPGEEPVFEHFQESRSQTKIRDTVRKTLQRGGWTLAALAAAYGLWLYVHGA